MRKVAYPSQNFKDLLLASRETPAAVRRSVSNILAMVRRRGDEALLTLTQKLDGVRLQSSELRVKAVTLRSARVAPDLAKAARHTLREVDRFARASLPKNWSHVNSHGARVGERFDPLRRAGIYVPGGSVPLMSTVFMTVPLAQAAGVKEIVVCTPPPISEALLWALQYCGVSEVYQVGGAQAMAAMACGTHTIRPVDKLFGPGNVYVTEAKRQLFGTVGVDLLAGPSELMVLADESTRTDWAAADLLAQAEHGSGRERIFCVSPSQDVLKTIGKSLLEQASRYAANRGLTQVLKHGTWLIQTRTRDQMVETANLLAPEHVQVMTRKPRELAARICTAGGIFIGNHSPTVVGDFVAGPSHTLPTGGAGRSFSGLRVMDFMRRTSLVEYSKTSLKLASKSIRAFARVERLRAHEESLNIRI